MPLEAKIRPYSVLFCCTGTSAGESDPTVFISEYREGANEGGWGMETRTALGLTKRPGWNHAPAGH